MLHLHYLPQIESLTRIERYIGTAREMLAEVRHNRHRRTLTDLLDYLLQQSRLLLEPLTA